MALAYLGTLAPEVRPGSLLASLPAASLFLGLSPSYFDNPLRIRLLHEGFPGTIGMNSDFRDLEAELALKTGPWIRTTGGAIFKQLPPEPQCSPGSVTGVEFLQPGPAESAQTAPLLLKKSFWETCLKKGSIAFIFNFKNACSKTLALI